MLEQATVTELVETLKLKCKTLLVYAEYSTGAGVREEKAMQGDIYKVLGMVQGWALPKAEAATRGGL